MTMRISPAVHAFQHLSPIHGIHSARSSCNQHPRVPGNASISTNPEAPGTHGATKRILTKPDSLPALPSAYVLQRLINDHQHVGTVHASTVDQAPLHSCLRSTKHCICITAQPSTCCVTGRPIPHTCCRMAHSAAAAAPNDLTSHLDLISLSRPELAAGPPLLDSCPAPATYTDHLCVLFKAQCLNSYLQPTECPVAILTSVTDLAALNKFDCKLGLLK